MEKLPEFTGGHPFVDLTDIPMIGYLKGDFGKAFLGIYNTVVEERYNDNKYLKPLFFDREEEVVKGSSTFSSILASEILKSNGYELATPFHIELARKKYNFDTRGHYVDLGVVWRSTENPNSYHAKQLEPQINYALGKTPEHSVVILSSMLNLTNDKNAPYENLGLSLREGATPFEVPALDKDTKSNETDENGMPIPYSDGNRVSYTNDSGLSRLCLDRYLGLDSGWDDLADSGSAGRVVVIKK